MKLFKQLLYVALVSIGGCGDGGTARHGSQAVDVAAYLPKLPSRADRADVVPRDEPSRVDANASAPVVATPSTVEDAVAQGRTLFGKGDTTGAKALFEAAVKLDPKHAEPHMELARLYIAANERGHAMAEANKAVKLAPLSSRAWNTKGRAELHRFAYDDAILAFSRAIELDDGNVWAWNNLGYTELLLKNYGDAAEHLAEATSRSGATAYMFNNLGTALEQLDRLDEARAAFEAGGNLGSKQALASRKRLEGVKSIALFLPPGKPELVDSTRDDDELEHNDYHDGDHADEPTAQDGLLLDHDDAPDAAASPDADGGSATLVE